MYCRFKGLLRRISMAQFTNQASISYNGVTANSNIVTGEITQVLTASKTSVSGSYRRVEVPHPSTVLP